MGLTGNSKTVQSMRAFVRRADPSASLLIGGEPGTGRTGLLRRVCEKSGMQPCDYLHKIIVYDSPNMPPDSYSELTQQHRFVITDDRAFFDEARSAFSYTIWLQPLRERIADIPLLVHHFTTLFHPSADWNKREYMDKLLSYWWPLNVFELKRIVTSPDGIRFLPWEHTAELLPHISVKEIVSLKMLKYWNELESRNAPGEFFQIFMNSVERDVIESALEFCGGSRQDTADLLNIHRNTLTKKMKKLGIKWR